MLVIIDYGVGNLASISNMFRKIGVSSIVSSNVNDVLQASKIVLPGVGSFDTCARRLRQSGLLDALTHQVQIIKVPIMGVCVGMQLLFEKSEEGLLPGLAWIKGEVVRFDAGRMPIDLKIPHMGWASVIQAKASLLLNGLDDQSRFYFVHSYHVAVANQDDTLLTATCGYSFVAAIQRDNIIGVQFHPEKSHRFGMTLLGNFARF